MGAVDRQCLLAGCLAPIATCFGPSSAQIARNADCHGLTACIDECHVLDPRCDDMCRSNASEDARSQLEAVESCRAGRGAACGANDYYCLLTHCQGEEAFCFDPVPVPQGALSCTDFEGCLSECETNGNVNACRSACMRAASPNAYNGYLTLMGCLDFFAGPIVECAVSSEGEIAMCQRWVCEFEYIRCHDERVRPNGAGLTCAETQLCMEACADEPRCESGCYYRTTHEDFGPYARLTFCRSHSQCEVDDHACLQANCAFDYEACIGPIDASPERLDCVGLETCLANCAPADSPCQNTCQMAVTAQVQSEYDALQACRGAHGCQSDNPGCLIDNCGAEWSACQGQ